MILQERISKRKLTVLVISVLLIITGCNTNPKDTISQDNEGNLNNSNNQKYDKKNDLKSLKKNMEALISPYIYAQQFLNTNIFTLNKDSTINDLTVIKDELDNTFYNEWENLIEEKNRSVTSLKEMVGEQKYSNILFDQTNTLERETKQILDDLKVINSKEQLNTFIGELENMYFSYDTQVNLLLIELPYLPDDLGYTEYENQRIAVQTYSKALHKYADSKIAEKFDKENLID